MISNDEAINAGKAYADAMEEFDDALEALEGYDHNADPTGQIEERVRTDFAHATRTMSKALARLLGVR